MVVIDWFDHLLQRLCHPVPSLLLWQWKVLFCLTTTRLIDFNFYFITMSPIKENSYCKNHDDQ
jgi:hypothetical protein